MPNIPEAARLTENISQMQRVIADAATLKALQWAALVCSTCKGVGVTFGALDFAVDDQRQWPMVTVSMCDTCHGTGWLTALDVVAVLKELVADIGLLDPCYCEAVTTSPALRTVRKVLGGLETP